jgi:hypothetical protein
MLKVETINVTTEECRRPLMNNSPRGTGRALDGVFWDERVRACRQGDETWSLFDHSSYLTY